MRSFITRLLFFLLPITFLAAPALYLLISSKECLYNIDWALDNYNEQKYLIGYVYNEDNYRYLKYKGTYNRPKTEVLILGSSRVLQFREK